MNRRDTHLDAMLRHLGAAYYQSLHGRAAQAEVDRAVDAVAGHFGEESPQQPATTRPEAGYQGSGGARHQHHGRGRTRGSSPAS